MAYKYALLGSPPFNFTGHLCETQKKNFYKWLDKRTDWHPKIKEWYQIRAHQLRKTAGLLEEFYNTKHPDPDAPEPMKPTFEKDAWKPGKDGHFTYQNRNDQVPSITVSRIKDRHLHMLQRDDEGMFWMNWLRNHIERHEDKANLHSEAPGVVASLRSELDAMFTKPEYQAVLVRNESELYKGEPYFRVNPLDEPTIWEKEQFNHSDKGRVEQKQPDGNL